MIRWISLIVCLLGAGCNLYNAPLNCEPDMTNAQAISYKIIMASDEQTSNAAVAATRDVGGKTITVLFDDTGTQDALIQFQLTGDLAADEVRTYDPTLSVSDNYVWPLYISGRGPDGSEGGVYSGNFIVTEITSAYLSGQIDFTYYLGNALPVGINADLRNVPLQPCR